MKFKPLVVLVVASIAGLSACSKNTPPADSLPVAAPAATTPAATAPDNALADFTVEPGQVFACDGRDRTVSTVKWQVKDPTVTTVRVEVDTALEPERKTFTIGGASGEALTGEWVGKGVRFHLVDGATGKELAGYEVISLPCE